jgi:exosome complex RNA-binding protein Rrp42 (RNase PH superfamily)
MHDGADVLKTMRVMDIAGSVRRLEKNRLFRNPKFLACTSEHKIGQRSIVDYNLEEKTFLQTKLIIAKIQSKATEYLTAKD